MARELGLGITPWSPLKSGALSGKYTRKNAGQVKVDRTFLVAGSLNETTCALVDELALIAKAHASTVPAVALAWVQAQAGVSSTIIGARRLAQLEDNVKALDVEREADRRGPRPSRSAYSKPDARLPAERAGLLAGDPQRRHVGERCPRAADDREGWRKAVLSEGGRREIEL